MNVRREQCKLNTHPWCGGHNSVGKHEEVEANQLENILEEANDLQSEHVLQEGGKVRQTIDLVSCNTRVHARTASTLSYLSAVVAHFKDGRLPADLARAVSVLLTVLQGVGGAAEALPL